MQPAPKTKLKGRLINGRNSRTQLNIITCSGSIVWLEVYSYCGRLSVLALDNTLRHLTYWRGRKFRYLFSIGGERHGFQRMAHSVGQLAQPAFTRARGGAYFRSCWSADLCTRCILSLQNYPSHGTDLLLIRIIKSVYMHLLYSIR